MTTIHCVVLGSTIISIWYIILIALVSRSIKSKPFEQICDRNKWGYSNEYSQNVLRRFQVPTSLAIGRVMHFIH